MDLAVGAFIHAANTKSWMPEAVKTKTTAPSTRVSWQTNTAALVVQTQELLERERSKRKKQVVVIVDEAHLLRPSHLEQLRLLTNAEMDSQAPFAGILVG